jgi:sugar/nucleoside kinase (ribokinase family)
VGTVVVDIVMHIRELPEPGGDVVASASMLAVGGALNVMSAAHRQGLQVVYAGGHGTGPFGVMVRASLAENDIEVAAQVTPGADTGFTVTFVTGDGERTFATARGAEAAMTQEALDALEVRPNDLVYISGYGLADPGSGAIIAGWASRLETGITVVADPGPLVAQIPEPLLQMVAERCDWLTCNEREAHLMTGATGAYDAIGSLVKLAGREGVIVRLGSDGCLLQMRGKDVQHLPARHVEVVDTTGAGDAHTGTFMAALAHAVEPAEAVHRANVAASIAVSRAGPATAPTSEELRGALDDRQ